MRKLASIPATKLTQLIERYMHTCMQEVPDNERVQADLLPGQAVPTGELSSGKKLLQQIKSLVNSKDSTALEEKLRLLVRSIDSRESSILKLKTK